MRSCVIAECCPWKAVPPTLKAWASGQGGISAQPCLLADRPPEVPWGCSEPQSLWLEPLKSQVGAACFRDAGPALSLPPPAGPAAPFCHAGPTHPVWCWGAHACGLGCCTLQAALSWGGCFVLPWVPQESNVDCLPVVCPVLPRAECLACRVCVGVCLAKDGSFGATHGLPLGSPLPSFEGFIGIRVAVSLALGLIAPIRGCPLCWGSLGALH